jgi:hypothetical protein
VVLVAALAVVAGCAAFVFHQRDRDRRESRRLRRKVAVLKSWENEGGRLAAPAAPTANPVLP